MGDLVKMPFSEVSATLEILDRSGVSREHLSTFRAASRQFQQQVAVALMSGKEGFFVQATQSLTPEDNVEFELGGKTFALLNLGCCDLNEAERKADEQGFVVAEDEWREMFQQRFPIPTRRIAVFFKGNVESSRIVGQIARVLFMWDDWKPWGARSCFGTEFGTAGRWLVHGKKEPRMVGML